MITARVSAGLIGGLIAAAGNYVVYFVARAAGTDFLGNFDGDTASPLPVVAIGLSSIMPGLVAGAIVIGLGRVTARPMRVFVPAAALFALASLVPSMSIAGASLATRLALSSMHVVAAAAIVGVLVRQQAAAGNATLGGAQ